MASELRLDQQRAEQSLLATLHTQPGGNAMNRIVICTFGRKRPAEADRFGYGQRTPRPYS
jgi:hypothetical protein